MKTFFNLLLFHLKREVKDIKFLGLILILPFSLILGGQFIGKNINNSKYSLSIVSESKYFDKEIKGKLNNYYLKSFNEDFEREKNRVLEDEVSLLIHIPKDFEREKKINFISLYGKNFDVIFNESIESILKEKLSNSFMDDSYGKIIKEYTILSENNLNNTKPFSFIYLQMYYIMFTNIMLSSDYNSMLNKKVQKRVKVSPLDNKLVTSSLLSSYFIILTMVYSLLTLLQFKLENGELIHFYNYFIVNIMMILFTMSLTKFLVTNIRSKEGFTSIGLIVTLIFFLVPLVSDSINTLKTLQYLSPLYWAINSFFENKLFPNILIIFLMSLFLFLMDFTKEES